MLNVTAVLGGNNTTLGLDFAITIDLRQVVLVTVHTEPLLPAHAKTD